MRVRIVAIGRCRDAALLELTARYLERCTFAVEVIELAPRGRASAAVLAAVPTDARTIALDERGDDLSSNGLAEQLCRWRDDGNRQICFLIGGADGLDAALLARADRRVAFGRATWPHLLVRVMLAEQLYRVSSILSGHPYHRG